MPRNSRIDIPGLLQHVIVRGIDRQAIFIDDQDRDTFVSRFSLLLKETATDCYAWAMLDNHFHLLIRPTSIKLSTFMRRLLTSYAVVFNLRHNRSGHLFQNRYKSIVCDEEPYLLELVRYIHLNPVRAHMINDLNALIDYPWCGHAELMGKASSNLLKSEEVLPLFSRTKKKAIQNYLHFMEDGLQNETTVPLSSGGKLTSINYNSTLDDDCCFDSRILGGGDFVESVLDGKLLPSSNFDLSFSDLSKRIAAYYEIASCDLSKPNKAQPIANAKAVICYIAIRYLQLKGVDIAPKLGYSSAAVSHATKRGKQILDEDNSLQKILRD